MNESKDIRPYAIVLVDADVQENYPVADVLFGEKKFTWDRYKDEIEKNQNIMSSNVSSLLFFAPFPFDFSRLDFLLTILPNSDSTATKETKIHTMTNRI